jgi:hypothetical protein
VDGSPLATRSLLLAVELELVTLVSLVASDSV